MRNGKEIYTYLNHMLICMKWWPATLPSNIEKGNDDAIAGKHGSDMQDEHEEKS